MRNRKFLGKIVVTSGAAKLGFDGKISLMDFELMLTKMQKNDFFNDTNFEYSLKNKYDGEIKSILGKFKVYDSEIWLLTYPNKVTTILLPEEY